MVVASVAEHAANGASPKPSKRMASHIRLPVDSQFTGASAIVREQRVCRFPRAGQVGGPADMKGYPRSCAAQGCEICARAEPESIATSVDRDRAVAHPTTVPYAPGHTRQTALSWMNHEACSHLQGGLATLKKRSNGLLRTAIHTR
jgi:hypothetical protein